MKKILILSLACALSASAWACSNVFITNSKNSVVARTMDFPFNTGATIGYGVKGEKNTSVINMQKNAPIDKAVTWTNTHDFLGMTFLNGDVLVDGTNDAGLYAAMLYLPDFTKYPTYNAKDSRPMLGVADSVNYLLGTSSNVTEALQHFNQVQSVRSAPKIELKGKAGLYILPPFHLILRDHTGHSAVVEWIGGKANVHDNAGPVLTNSPSYDWQLQHAARYNYVSSENINAKFAGSYMNGSGFLGLPGDFTPPNRFARATQIIKHMPVPQNNNEAIQLALAAIETIQVPIGSSDSPSLWKSVADLNNRDYYIDIMYHVNPEYAVIGQPGVTISSPDISHAWRKFNVEKTIAALKTKDANGKRLKHFLKLALKQPLTASVKKIVSIVDQHTAGPKKHYQVKKVD